MKSEMATPCRQARRQGFTLFEVTLVLLVIGTVAAAVVPAVAGNMRSSKLKVAANVLAADLDFCAGSTISNPSKPMGINFDGTLNKYTVVTTSSGATATHPMDGKAWINDFATGRNTQFSDVTLGSITQGGAAATSVGFDSYGKPLGTGNFVVILNYKTQSLTLTVGKTTGDVTITE